MIAYRNHELAIQTQYAEVKERVNAAGALLPGTPGTLVLRGEGARSYWYRVYYSVPKKQSEKCICRADDEVTLAGARAELAFSNWVSDQVSLLRKLGYQVADKQTARVLVELHNQGAFTAGLVLVGTLAFMALINELGVRSVVARTMDIDLARPSGLKLAAALPFLEILKNTGLPFVEVPGLPNDRPSTSVKLPGIEGLRVDVLTDGLYLGQVVQLPEMGWAAQGIPFYEYLLGATEAAAVLAGGHCVPVRVPSPGRFIWHKLYASTNRQSFREKALKDRMQALLLALALEEAEPGALCLAANEAPSAMLEKTRSGLPLILKGCEGYPNLAEIFESCLG